jgi:DNA invertase Pin-like site-specific DNA recombinase
VASGDKTDRSQLSRAIGALGAGDGLMVTRLDRLARSTRDLLNTLAAITSSKVIGGLAVFERDLIRMRAGGGRAWAIARGGQMPFYLRSKRRVPLIIRFYCLATDARLL